MPDDQASDDSQDPSSFPSNQQFQQEVQNAISELGGFVFPKLNWSSPQDATWSVPLLKCASYSDIFLALQCSSLLHYDLEMFKMESQITPYLVLKKWKQLPEGSQFRCFVKQKKLVGISQRDCSLYFPSIKKLTILSKLASFFSETVCSKVPLLDYIVDVSVEATQIWIIDINPWNESTTPLLFDWQELETIKDEVKIKIVENASLVKASRFDQFRAPVQFQAPNLGDSVAQFIQEMKKSYIK